MMKGRALILVVIFILVAVLSGCAGSRTYLIDVRYIPTEQGPPASKPETAQVVGICPFDDARKERVKDTIGIRQRTRNEVDFLKAAGITVADSVTRAVKEYFKEKGFEVTDCKGWDGSPEGLANLPNDLSLVVAGSIESFMVDARSGIATTETQYRVKMAVSIGHVADRKVVIRTIDSAPQTKKMTFDPGQVAAYLNQTLTEAIRNLFK
jgi:hypothetical protein